MDPKSLWQRIDTLWEEMQGLFRDYPDVNWGPASLVQFELGSLSSRISEAKLSNDSAELQECLAAIKTLYSQLKLLLP